jgi:hypothetical protein
MKLTKLILIINIIIISLYGLFQYLWFTFNYYTLVELLLTGIIIPIIISYILIKHSISYEVKLYYYILPLIQIIIVSNLYNYLNWGIWSGNLLRPDSETLEIVQTVFITSLLLVLSICSLYSILHYFLKKAKLIKIIN